MLCNFVYCLTINFASGDCCLSFVLLLLCIVYHSVYCLLLLFTVVVFVAESSGEMVRESP